MARDPASRFPTRANESNASLELGPPVEDGHDLVFLLGRQREHDAVDAELAVAFQALEVGRHAEGAYRQAGRIAARLLRHGTKLVEHVDPVAVEPVVARDPAVA